MKHMVNKATIWKEYEPMILKNGLKYIWQNNVDSILRNMVLFGDRKTLRELSRLLDVPHSSLRPAVHGLVSQGILLTEPVGRSVLLSINKSHLYYKPLKTLFETEASSLKILANKVAKTISEKVYSVFVFGSASKGVAEDIDLIIICEKEDINLDQAVNIVEQSTGGMELDAKVYSPKKFKESLKRKSGFLVNFEQQHICLYGLNFDEIVDGKCN